MGLSLTRTLLYASSKRRRIWTQKAACLASPLPALREEKNSPPGPKRGYDALPVTNVGTVGIPLLG